MLQYFHCPRHFIGDTINSYFSIASSTSVTIFQPFPANGHRLRTRSERSHRESIRIEWVPARLEYRAGEENFISPGDLCAGWKGPRLLERASLLAIITFRSQPVIKSAIRTSGLPAIKTTMDRHFVRRARKKVAPVK